MKKILLLLAVFSFIIITSNAQETISSDWTSVTQSIDASMHQHKKFRISAAIKKEAFNGNEKASVWARVDRSDKKRGFFSNPYRKNQITGDWKRFRVEGTIDENAEKLVFGLMAMNNGKFFFDDVRLEIQNEKGEWATQKIRNPNFENKPDNSGYVWGNATTSKIKQFSTTIINEDPYSGNHALLVEGKGVYGQNDDKGGFITANGIKFYYEIYGQGTTPLLMLHGNGQSMTAFQNQIDFFSKKYKVIVVDSRGRGRSTDNDYELTYTIQATDMKFFLDELKIDAAHIIGWSDGGIIGILMAIKYPEKVKKLVAMGANINPEGLFPERLELHKKNLKKLEDANDLQNKIYIKLYKLLINYPNLTFDDLKPITSPTLIMAGDHDVIQDMHTVKMFQAIPNAHLAILPGETHWLPSANPELFNETVMKFLTEEFITPRRF